MATRLSPEVERFLAEHVRSVEQLEVLLRLFAEPERLWTSADVAKELRIDPVSAARRLADLVKQELATPVEGGAEPAFRSSGAEAPAVAELARCYQSMRVSVIQAIYSRPAENIQLFADAFRLRRDDDGEKS